MRFKEKSAPLYLAGLPSHVLMRNFYLTQAGSREDQVISYLDQMTHFSYEHAKFF